MLKVNRLNKSFSSQLKAVDNLSFQLQAGEKVGFLGLNGAGKTTTYRLISGLLGSDGGEIEIAGHPLARQRRKAQRQLGYLPESSPLCPELTPRRHLRILCGLYRLDDVEKKISDMLERCELGEVKDRHIRDLSKGYRQRVALASTLIHDPAVLLLDEPTSGLDPKQVDQFRKLIVQNCDHRAVLLSTHVLSEVEAMCNRVIVLRKGTQVLDTPLPLKDNLSWWVEWRGDQWPEDVMAGVEHHDLPDGWNSTSLLLEDPTRAPEMLSKLQSRVQVRHFSKTHERLEDLFLKITAPETAHG